LHMPINPDLKRDLEKNIQGEVKDDFVSRLLYSTDASIYKIEPLGVVFPKYADELNTILELAVKHHTPILARGSGSSLAGQAVGPALVIDTTRYLNRILNIDTKNRTAAVEPGVILMSLNRQAALHGLMFGPDPASAERASIGGSVASNATGAHSIQFGMFADHIKSSDVILSDGSQTRFESISTAAAERKLKQLPENSIESNIYHAVLEIRNDHAESIRDHWPRVWRRASGYNLNYLIPWSPSQPPQWHANFRESYPPVSRDQINLSTLMAGSEGTLGVLRQVTLRLVPVPKHTILGVIMYPSIAEACDAAPELLERQPSAIELIPGEMIRLARDIPAYARQLAFVQGTPEAMLVVEFSGDDPASLKERVRQLGEDVLVAETKQQQDQVWNVRKMGLGILNSLPGDNKPLAFVEDLSVPVEKLGYFVREMQKIMAEHDTYANFYAHASAGCLHIRPVISTKGPEEVARLKSISEQVIHLAVRLQGAASGEHGDGIARAQYLESNFGGEIYSLFRKIKQAADPQNLMNPGKKIDPFPMDQNLRYGVNYQTRTWQPFFDYSRQESLTGAIEMCNGQGVCLKGDGLMCPSFQALHDEMHSTRGRANLLRELISGGFPSGNFPEDAFGEKAVMQALDLCLACKGCKSECPSAVDVAKLKFEFLYHYYQKHPHRLRDYLFAYIDRVSPLMSPLAGVVNTLLGNPLIRRFNQGWLGLAAERRFPTFVPPVRKAPLSRHITAQDPNVLFLLDSFSRDFHPETAIGGVRALEACGLQVEILPVVGAGRALTTKGFLDTAKEHARELLDAINRIDPQGILPVVGVEPSEVFMLRDEYLDYFPGDERVAALSRRSWMIDEFLIRPGYDGVIRLEKLFEGSKNEINPGQVLLHGQCVQKVQPPAADGYPVGAQATLEMLEKAGFQVEMVEAGCCGMAGAFGYEAEHYNLSMKVGEMALFPAIRSVKADVVIAASGTSCRSQIKGGTDRTSVHPINLLMPVL
jgi:FAD/FMN-containing dehydrogenase/Fe-S oxidoreductase